MAVLELARKQNRRSPKGNKAWGEPFYAGSGGKRFEGKGGGRAGGSTPTWVSSMPMVPKAAGSKSASRGPAKMKKR